MGLRMTTRKIVFQTLGCKQKVVQQMNPQELIVMFNGELKAAKDVVVGDILMGDDSTPREVLTTYRGRDEMFKVTPHRGEPFVATKDCGLSLVSSRQPALKTYKKEKRFRVKWMENGKETSKTFSGLTEESHKKAQEFKEKLGFTGDHIAVPLGAYANKAKSWKTQYKGYRVDVGCWKEREVTLDPYMLGVWLGDGTSRQSQITNIEPEIIEEFNEKLAKMGLKMRSSKCQKIRYDITRDTSKMNGFMRCLKEHNLVNNKHIPEVYKINSRKVRLEVLAGLLDTDGSYGTGIFEITQKSNQLAADIIFLARSLGFYVSHTIDYPKTCYNNGVTGIYQRMFICGNVMKLPQECTERKQPEENKSKTITILDLVLSLWEQVFSTDLPLMAMENFCWKILLSYTVCKSQ